MDLKECRKLAEHEVYRYRDHQAYVQAVLDCGKLTGGEKLNRSAKWVLSVDYAKEYLERHDPLKAKFFSLLFGLERPRRRGSEARTIISLSMELSVSAATLYKWRNEALSLVVLAAAQTGALRPYAIGEQRSDPSDREGER